MDIKNLNKMIFAMRNSFNNGPRFVSFDLDSLVISLFLNVGSAANPDSSLQLVFVITLIDQNGNVNIVYYSSL